MKEGIEIGSCNRSGIFVITLVLNLSEADNATKV